MIELIETVKQEGDSIGGVIRGVIRHVPPGLGEPVFDKLSADNDAINSNLEMIQHQNSLIINLLTELNNNIKILYH